MLGTAEITSPVCSRVFEHRTAQCGAHIEVSESQNEGRPIGSCLSFSTENERKYSPFAGDFQQLNMASTVALMELFGSQIPICTKQGCLNLVHCADSGPRSFSNAAYLLGSYLILSTEETPNEVAQRFDGFDTNLFENFRDVSGSCANFRLTLRDCWGGIYRGKQLGWIGNRDARSRQPLVGNV